MCNGQFIHNAVMPILVVAIATYIISSRLVSYLII